MGDRVRFGTLNDTVTPASSSGFTGFPFPVKAWPGSDPDGAHPIGLPWQEAIGWYWRVKNWSVDCGFFVTGSSATYDFALITNLARVGGDPASEMELAIPGRNADFYAEYTWSGQDVGLGPSYDVTASIELKLFMGNNYGDWPLWTLYPSMTLLAQIVAQDTLTTTHFELFTANAIIRVADGIDLGTVQDRSCDIYYNGRSSDDPVGNWAAGGSGLTYSPSEYWPYAAKDGTPIYDTADGHVLDPANYPPYS